MKLVDSTKHFLGNWCAFVLTKFRECSSDVKCQERHVAAPLSPVVGSPIIDIRSESSQPVLAEFLQLSRSWDFESAQSMIHKLDARDPITAFEIMRMHERRGSILDALCVAKQLTEGKAHLESDISILFNIATAYFNCLHRGLWADAFKTATSCCTGGLLHTPLTPAPRVKVGSSI
jgi:hypothetical protein